jgi:hypothetical protein
MRFDEKTKSGFLMLRAANLSIYRSRDDDAPSEVIPLRSSAVKVISGGDAMFALPAGAADSPRSSSAVDSESPSTTTTPPPSTSATPMPAANNNNNNNNSGLQRRDSPPRENAPSILSSLKNRRLRRGSIGSLPQSHVMSSLGHSPGRVISASASATPDESDDEPDGASTPTSSLPTVGGGSCVFALFTPAVSKTFLARDQEDMNEWVAKLNQAATRLLNEALEEVGVATAAAVEPDVTRSVRAAGGAVVSERELAKRVAALRALPGNDRCCDCGAADTAWVLANKGGLICIDCSGVHRQMGVTVSKVRSFELDQWSEPALAFLERTGNEALNERLEHRRANADRDRATLTRSDFLRKKYVDQAYVSTSKRATQLEEFVETFA